MLKKLQWITILLACTSQAYGEGLSNDRISLYLGGFTANRDSTARLDAETPEDGTELNLEGDLGLETSGTVFRLDGIYRFNRTHRAEFAFFDLSRKSDGQVIDREVQFGDQTYAINTQINSRFDLFIFKAAYAYTFLSREQWFLASSLGLYTASMKAELSATNVAGSLESDSLIAPLPVIGLRGEYQIAPRWRLRGSAELFQIKIDNVDGRLSDVLVGVDFQVNKQVAIGLGYNYAKFNVESTNDKFLGAFDWRYDGALIFAKIGFGKT